MRRLQTQERHTDCTCREILGRRNRYALAAQTRMGTPAISYFLWRKNKNGISGLFPLCHTGAGPSNSSLADLIKGVTFMCPASVSYRITAKTTVKPVSEGFSCPLPHRIVRRRAAVRIDTRSHDRHTFIRPQHLPKSYGGCCESISHNAEAPDANLHFLLSSIKCRLTSSALFFSTPYDKGRPFRSINVSYYTIIITNGRPYQGFLVLRGTKLRNRSRYVFDGRAVLPKPSNDIPTANQPRPNLYKEQQQSDIVLFFIRTAPSWGQTCKVGRESVRFLLHDKLT